MIHVLYSNNTRDSGFFGYPDSDVALRAEWYEHVATLDLATAEDAWLAMNVVDGDEVPTRIRHRSMMVGDVVLITRANAIGLDVYVCAPSGWRLIAGDLARQLVLRVRPDAPRFDDSFRSKRSTGRDTEKTS